MDTNSIRYNVDVSGCSPEVIKAITQTLSRVKEDLQRVADTNKEENKKKEVNKRWKPEIDENYFRILVNGHVSLDIWKNDHTDNDVYNLRNVFKTREEAEFEVERKKIMAELQNYADDHNSPDFDIYSDEIYWISYDVDEGDLFPYEGGYALPVNTILFSSEEVTSDAIEAIGEDRIIKYMFGIDRTKEVHCNGDCECCDEYNPWDDDEEDED